MAILIRQATRVQAAGNKPKLIDEVIGRSQIACRRICAAHGGDYGVEREVGSHLLSPRSWEILGSDSGELQVVEMFGKDPEGI